MKIKRFNESAETFKNTDEDIRLFFTDYTDDNLGTLDIQNALVKDGIVGKMTPYVKDPKKVRKCKIVTLNIGTPKGLKLPPNGNCMNDLETLENLILDIKRFYALSGEEINYIINTDFMGLSVKFITLGEYLTDSDSKSEEIDKFLGELKEIFKEKGKRPSLKGNWLELKGDINYISDYFWKITRGDWNRNHHLYAQSKFIGKLIDWYDKVTEAGFTVKTSTNERQFVVRLFNQ
jgi:hypothetical protein